MLRKPGSSSNGKLAGSHDIFQSFKTSVALGAIAHSFRDEAAKGMGPGAVSRERFPYRSN
jgi:hypothetical protein